MEIRGAKCISGIKTVEIAKALKVSLSDLFKGF